MRVRAAGRHPTSASTLQDPKNHFDLNLKLTILGLVYPCGCSGHSLKLAQAVVAALADMAGIAQMLFVVFLVHFVVAIVIRAVRGDPRQ